MRWLIVPTLAVLFFAYASTEASPNCDRSPNAKACRSETIPTPEPTPEPVSCGTASHSVQTALVVASDYSGPLSIDYAFAQVQDYLAKTKAQYDMQTDCSLRTEPAILHRSSYTQAEINQGEVDNCGDGLNWDFVTLTIAAELGWSQDVPFKRWYVVLGGGGYAGGVYSVGQPEIDHGNMVMGDWEMRWLSGNTSPCDAWPGVEQSGFWTFCHEAGHSLDLDNHRNESCGPSDVMDQANLERYLSANQRFLE